MIPKVFYNPFILKGRNHIQNLLKPNNRINYKFFSNNSNTIKPLLVSSQYRQGKYRIDIPFNEIGNVIDS